MTEITGIFVEELTSTGVDETDAAPVPYHPGITLVLGTSGGNNTGIILSDQCKIGDVVESYFDSGGLVVYVPAGETILSRGNSITATNVRLRKLSATEWGAIS